MVRMNCAEDLSGCDVTIARPYVPSYHSHWYVFPHGSGERGEDQSPSNASHTPKCCPSVVWWTG